jgi:hypothetical protein
VLEYDEQLSDKKLKSSKEKTGLDCLNATEDNVTAIYGMIEDTVAQNAIGISENKSSRLKSRNPAGGSRPAHTDYSIKEKERLRQDAINAAKKLFEKEQRHVLSLIPQSVRDMYGQIGFVKWSGSMHPVLVLNPYHVPPAPVREDYFVCMQTFVIVA